MRITKKNFLQINVKDKTPREYANDEPKSAVLVRYENPSQDMKMVSQTLTPLRSKNRRNHAVSPMLTS